MKHEKVAYEWSCQREATGSRMFSDGKTVFSYGRHFPIAHFLDLNTVLFNTDYYSSSTSKHQRYVRNKIPSCCTVYECDTGTIKKAVDYPNEPVIITKEKEITHLNEIIDIINNYFKSKGLKRFPRKKVEDFFRDQLLAKLI